MKFAHRSLKMDMEEKIDGHYVNNHTTIEKTVRTMRTMY